METLLDHLINALPMMGELAAVAKPRALEPELVTLTAEIVRMGKFLFGMGASLSAAAALKHLGLVVSGLFLTIFGVFLAVTSGSPQDVNAVKIELGTLKVAWQGAAGLGCMVAGALLMILAYSLHQI